MKRSRVRLRRLVPLAFLLIPPLFWATVLAVTPTEWARTRILALIEEETGRPIRLGGLKLGVCGGVYLRDLEIGTTGSTTDPWFKAASARIDVSVLQLLAGHLEPSKIEVSGLALRVLRRDDGTLELADLLMRAPTKPRSSAVDSTEAPAALDILLCDGQITIIDEPSRTHLNLTKIQGHVAWQGRQLNIQHLQGSLNGGILELALALDRTTKEPVFESRIRAHNVELDQGSNTLVYLLPILAGTTDVGAMDGRLDANLYVKGQGATHESLQRSLTGQGSILVDSIALERSRFFVELKNLIDLPDTVQVGSVKSDFTIQRGRVATDNLTLEIANLPIVMAGWTDFDGKLDYQVRSDSLTDRLPDQARELLGELSIDTRDLSALRVRGTLQAMQLSVAPGLLGQSGASGGRGAERERLRDLGRRMRERILR
ncbi:AsmA protein [Singulisphaera sp. GP187]|uniref:AsmA family protein n=1 Tax=Singulisphaera sp. GP187 TaxID=1882752 RepID=UPI00092B30C5|nr:AsmA family protein [Singulisphaera sp. GP187]SIO12158.1 AsmA protein [Singulisphaera sp. GP187]